MERVKGIEPSSKAWEALALPLSYTRGKKKLPAMEAFFIMAGATGLEPATYGVTGRHSNQSELRPRIKKVAFIKTVSS